MVRFIKVLGLALIAASFGVQSPIYADEKDEPKLGEPPQAPQTSLLGFNQMAGREVVVIEENPAITVLRTAPSTIPRGEEAKPSETPIEEGEVRDTRRGIMFDATIQEFRWSATNPDRLVVGFRNTISNDYTTARFCNLETGEILDDSSASSAFNFIENNLGAPIRIWLSEYEIGEKRRNSRWRRGSTEPEFTIRPSRYYCIESFFLSASSG
ncbi:MAG: hypothetical protein AAGJ85_05945 [Pseudomonadota bacterium]